MTYHIRAVIVVLEDGEDKFWHFSNYSRTGTVRVSMTMKEPITTKKRKAKINFKTSDTVSSVPQWQEPHREFNNWWIC